VGPEAWAGSKAVVEMRYALTDASHFGHRETDDLVVDLFWSRRVGDEFRVEVQDRREHVRFVLYPTTGKEAIQAFYHPFALGSDHVRARSLTSQLPWLCAATDEFGDGGSSNQ
jgi:hypothetical protein